MQVPAIWSDENINLIKGFNFSLNTENIKQTPSIEAAITIR
jgi:hypothetical protein